MLEQAQAAEDGEASETVQVPDWAEPGDTLLFVVDTDRDLRLSNDFEVVAREGGGGEEGSDTSGLSL